MTNEPKPIADPLKAVMARIDAKRTGHVEDHAKQVAEDVHAEVAPVGTLPPEQGWLFFAPMPSDLCRVSPFFPMNKNQLDRREYIKGMMGAPHQTEICVR